MTRREFFRRTMGAAVVAALPYALPARVTLAPFTLHYLRDFNQPRKTINWDCGRTWDAEGGLIGWTMKITRKYLGEEPGYLRGLKIEYSQGTDKDSWDVAWNKLLEEASRA